MSPTLSWQPWDYFLLSLGVPWRYGDTGDELAPDGPVFGISLGATPTRGTSLVLLCAGARDGREALVGAPFIADKEKSRSRRLPWNDADHP